MVSSSLRSPPPPSPLVNGFFDGNVGSSLMTMADKIKDDPGSEEQQGKNLIDAAIGAGTIECLLWSTLPSSKVISGGRFVSRIYEGTSFPPSWMVRRGPSSDTCGQASIMWMSTSERRMSQLVSSIPGTSTRT